MTADRLDEPTYETRNIQQLEQWLAGNPQHNKIDNECCPDFSCCKPELLAPVETRRAFVQATPRERDSMLFGFLGAAIAAAGKRDVYIAGLSVEES